MKLEKGLKIKFKYPESSNNDNREQFKAKEQHTVWWLKMIPPPKKNPKHKGTSKCVCKMEFKEKFTTHTFHKISEDYFYAWTSK